MDRLSFLLVTLAERLFRPKHNVRLQILEAQIRFLRSGIDIGSNATPETGNTVYSGTLNLPIPEWVIDSGGFSDFLYIHHSKIVFNRCN